MSLLPLLSLLSLRRRTHMVARYAGLSAAEQRNISVAEVYLVSLVSPHHYPPKPHRLPCVGLKFTSKTK